MAVNTSMLPGVASICGRNRNCSCNRAASFTPSRTVSLQVGMLRLILCRRSPRLQVVCETRELCTVSVRKFSGFSRQVLNLGWKLGLLLVAPREIADRALIKVCELL